MSRKQNNHNSPLLSVKELTEKARLYAKSAKAPSTLRAYRSDWLQFENWCRLHRLQSLPASPETVALYIADIASNHAVATITRRLCSITERHRASGFANSPAKAHHLVVSETMKGIRRVFGTVQKGKSPLLTADIRKIVSKCPRGTRGDRDKLLILIGFAGAFRRSELAHIRVQDLSIYKDGVIIDLPRSKTDQEGEGRKVGIPRGSKRATCPVRALEHWLTPREDQYGFSPPSRLQERESPDARVTSRFDWADHQASSGSSWDGCPVHCRAQSSSRLRHTGGEERRKRSTDHEADRPQVRRNVAALYPRPEDSRTECSGTARHLMPSRSRPWRVQIRLRHARRDAIWT